MAVLCRTRAQIAPIAEALEERGVPYEVIGLGGMLDVPEVADVRAALIGSDAATDLLRPLVGRSVVGIVPRFRADIADLDLRLDDGGRIELFTSWSAASWRLETP